MTRFIPTLLFCFATSVGQSAFSEPKFTAEELLEKKFMQADEVEVFDGMLESEVEMKGKKVKSRTRLKIDKINGRASMQQYRKDSDQIHMDIKVEGSNVYFKNAKGNWIKMPMDSQTQETLEGMGINFTGAEGGLAGQGKLEKDKTKRNANKLQKARDKVLKLKQKFDLKRAEDLDDPSGKSRAVVFYPKGLKKLFDAQVEWIDEETGLVMESCHFVREDRYPQGREKIPGWARRKKDEVGNNMAEIYKNKVLATSMNDGLPMVAESESMSETGAGTVKQKHVWKILSLARPQ